MPIAIISTILNVIASSGIADGTISQLVGFVAAATGRGDISEQAAKDLLRQVRLMVSQKRGPTPAEWAEWDARLDAAHGRLQA